MRKIVLLALLANVVLLFPFGGFARAAGECLGAPNGASPRGSHWYYHFDRASRRKCWYLAPQSLNTSPGATQVAADERRTAPPTSSAPAAAPAAAAAPVARQTESEQWAQTSADTLPREVLAPAPLIPLKSAATSGRAPAPTSEPDIPSAADSQDAVPAAAPDPAPAATSVSEQPAAAPPTESPIHWGTLILLVAGALGVAGLVGRAAFRHPDAQRLDQYAGHAQSPASFRRAWTMREDDHAFPDHAASADAMPVPVPYLRAPNLAWLADDALHEPSEPTEGSDDMRAEPWRQPELRRTGVG